MYYELYNASWSVTVPDVDTIRDVFGFRIIIELAGLEALFTSEDEKMLERAGTLFDDVDLDMIIKDREDYLIRDRELHKIFACSIKNSRVMETFNKLSVWVDWVRQLLPRTVITQSGLNEHKLLCLAIKKRNLQEAKIILTDHIKRAELDFVNLMSQSRYNNFSA